MILTHVILSGYVLLEYIINEFVYLYKERFKLMDGWMDGWM